MAKDPSNRIGDKALEMIMRDVLGGLEEFALIKGLNPTPGVMEVLAIHPSTDDDRTESGSANQSDSTRDNIVCLQQRRLRKVG